MRQLGYLQMSDFDAIEEDMLFTIHKITVSNEVHETLLIMSRLNKNKIDKSLREKYGLIAKNQSKYFPLEVLDN
jgi:hypothetical protein